MAIGGGFLAAFWLLGREDGGRLGARAESAARAGDWHEALRLWRRINATQRATGATYLAEAKAALALGLAAQAERALRKSHAATPEQPEALLLLLEIFRVEDRPLDAFLLSWESLNDLALEARLEVLRELTLTALTDLPDDLARTTLKRWITADPVDVDAQVAFLKRVGAEPRADDPHREARLAQLMTLLEAQPEHVGIREALVTAFADAGEPDRGRALLENWPLEARDGRFWRLQGRWNLEHDHRPVEAVAAFQKALVDFPQDWRTHYRLARALQVTNQPVEARRAAETVGRIRELLEPMTLGPTLDKAFAHLGEPAGLRTLAELCSRVGLERLANAWRETGLEKPRGPAAVREPQSGPHRELNPRAHYVLRCRRWGQGCRQATQVPEKKPTCLVCTPKGHSGHLKLV